MQANENATNDSDQWEIKVNWSTRVIQLVECVGGTHTVRASRMGPAFPSTPEGTKQLEEWFCEMRQELLCEMVAITSERDYQEGGYVDGDVDALARIEPKLTLDGFYQTPFEIAHLGQVDYQLVINPCPETGGFDMEFIRVYADGSRQVLQSWPHVPCDDKLSLAVRVTTSFSA